MPLWSLWITALALGRIALGLAPILAAGPASRLLGFPPEHDNASTRLFGRLFGIRDIGLGVLVLFVADDPLLLWWSFVFNALHDLGDACVIAVPLLRKQGIDRAACLSLTFALGGLLCWLISLGLWERVYAAG